VVGVDYYGYRNLQPLVASGYRMVTVGDQAPDFTAALVTDTETTATTLSDQLGSGPVVLAFFPAAWSTTCTAELCTFRDSLGQFNDLGATVFGISTDTSYALEQFREDEDLTFGLLSDNDGSIIDAYDIVDDQFFADKGMKGVATRSVFVVDTEGTVQYDWIADNPGQEPDHEPGRGTVRQGVDAPNEIDTGQHHVGRAEEGASDKREAGSDAVADREDVG